VVGKTGVSPPAVHEYMYSCNNTLLINIPEDDNDEEFEEGSDFYI
jgi:hypothetical protein